MLMLEKHEGAHIFAVSLYFSHVHAVNFSLLLNI